VIYQKIKRLVVAIALVGLFASVPMTTFAQSSTSHATKETTKQTVQQQEKSLEKDISGIQKSIDKTKALLDSATKSNKTKKVKELKKNLKSLELKKKKLHDELDALKKKTN
jgi:peptidoglycan hydrolase CwlO-like protein